MMVKPNEPIVLIYKVRYGILDSNIIFNEAGSYTEGSSGWDNKSVKIREDIWQQKVDNLNKENGFYNKLEKSILKNGFRNPILVDAGSCRLMRKGIQNPFLPIEMQQDHAKILTCNYNGGSRLMIAQKHNLQIPCIISDFVDRFPNFKLLKTKKDIISCYTDPPFRISFNAQGLRLHLFLDLNVTWGKNNS